MHAEHTCPSLSSPPTVDAKIQFHLQDAQYIKVEQLTSMSICMSSQHRRGSVQRDGGINDQRPKNVLGLSGGPWHPLFGPFGIRSPQLSRRPAVRRVFFLLHTNYHIPVRFSTVLSSRRSSISPLQASTGTSETSRNDWPFGSWLLGAISTSGSSATCQWALGQQLRTRGHL